MKLYLVKDGGAVPLDTQKDGQYLCFNADGTQFTFYVERTPVWDAVNRNRSRDVWFLCLGLSFSGKESGLRIL